MSSPSSVISLGYGSWGTTGLVLGLGYSTSAAADMVYGPCYAVACDVFVPWLEVDVLIPVPSADPMIPGIREIDIELP
jgi:hypothetical protein